MSDLGGGSGRASNGGARTGGPVPVQSSGTPSQGIRTPRDVMRDRNAREARRQEEQKAEEARRIADERRRSAERRGAAFGGVQGRREPQYVQQEQQGYDGAADRRSGAGAGRVSGADVLGEPVSRTQEYPRAQEYTTARTRVPSAPQLEQPRVAQPTTGGARRTQQSQGQPRQSSAPATTGAQSTADSAQRNTTSSFPHAFERWETLSSHWEGLTSYWLHKLEQNTEEIRTTIPNASTLNRQITDLSAAGANLFHAVVELQRLRASSERKFQRWFFENRAEAERNSENQGQLERQIRLERSAREEAATKRAEAEEAAAVAKREVAEMRRELMISKEEARRAWEELGRQSDEAQQQANNLKAGRIVTVGGVQVVPYYSGPSRSDSAHRPPTSQGYPPPQPGPGAAGLASPGDEREYYREPSPTNTDPFTEQQQEQPLRHEPDKPSLAAGTYRPAGGAPQQQRSREEADRFYTHGGSENFLHSPQSSQQGIGQQMPPSQTPPNIQINNREDVRSEASYVDTLSEGDTEYAIDAAGNIRHDDVGRPIVIDAVHVTITC